MPNVNVLDGSAARAIHVRQILNWLRGVPTNSEPVKFIGITNRDDFALTVRNNDPTNDILYGKALNVQNSAATISLFEVGNYGVIMRPNVDGGTILSVRNFADTDDVFTITTAGASLGGLGDVVTTGGTQTLLNKTLTDAILGSARIGDYIDIDQGSAPANPDAGDLRIYALTGSSILALRTSSGVEKRFVDEDSAQTLSSKTINSSTLNSPTIVTPSITEYITLSDRTVSAPDPGATAAVIYKTAADATLKFKSGNNTERTIVDTSNTQTLAGKTLTSPVLNSPTVGESLTISDKTGAAPTIGATAAALYKTAADASLKFKAGNDTERTVVDTASSQVLTSKELTNPLIGSGARLAIGSAPSTPGASAAVLYYLTATNDVRYKAGNDTERVLMDTSSTQASITGKSFTSPGLTTPTVTGGLTMAIGSAPGDPGASAAIIYHKTAASTVLSFKAGNNTERVIVDTDTSGQTLTGKILNTATLNTPTIGESIVFNQRASAAPTVTATTAAIYKNSGDTFLKFKNGNDTERELVDTNTAQTLSAKIFTTPVVNDGLKINDSSVPSTPGATTAIIYKRASEEDLRYKSGDNNERIIMDTDSTQTISNKIFGAGLAFTTPSLTGPVIANYEDWTEAGIPGSPSATFSRLYYRSDGSFYYKKSNGTIEQLLTASNTATVAAVGWVRPMMLGGL